MMGHFVERNEFLGILDGIEENLKVKEHNHEPTKKSCSRVDERVSIILEKYQSDGSLLDTDMTLIVNKIFDILTSSRSSSSGGCDESVNRHFTTTSESNANYAQTNGRDDSGSCYKGVVGDTSAEMSVMKPDSETEPALKGFVKSRSQCRYIQTHQNRLYRIIYLLCKRGPRFEQQE